MILVKPSDFIGQYQLAKSISDSVLLQSYIDREEKKTIYKLLGKTLSDLLIAYIAIPKVALTSGALVAGQSYKITTYVPGDDFSNVGGANITGNIFIATGTTPTTWTHSSSLIIWIDRYEMILNPFYDDSEAGNWHHRFNDFYSDLEPGVHDSHGLKDLLLTNIFYWYVSETQARHSQSGVISNSVENANIQSFSNAFRLGESKWNNAGLDTWRAVRWLCLIKSPEVYPEYKGINESSRSSSFL